MKRAFYIILVFSAMASISRAQGVYSIAPQPVCWTFNGVDSNLLSLVVFDIRDTIGLFQGYVNAINGSYVNTTAGGSIAAGYCCCNGGGTSQTVSITDNNDGTYTAIVGTDTTIIYTKADSLYTTQTIAIGDTSYLANSVVQDILIAISQEVNNLRSETGCNLTITQASHGFAVGDLLTQDPNTGVYADAAADTSITFPVAYVCEVVDANNFKVDTEGWVSGAHGGTVWRDYFLQDVAGTVDTVPGSFPIFAWRTFSPTLRYFDIPEYVAAGSSGGGTVTASNGLNDQDAGVDVDVEWGGTLERNTFIYGEAFSIIWDSVRNFRSLNMQGDVRFETDTLGNRLASLVVDVANSTLRNQGLTENRDSYFRVHQFGELNLFIKQQSNDSLLVGLELDDTQGFVFTGVPDYASDAAADSDGGLPSGGAYTVYAEDRTLRIKP